MNVRSFDRTMPITARHLSALLGSFEELRSQRRMLISNLRALMDETLSQGEQLRDAWYPKPTPPSPASLAGRLRSDHGLTPREVQVALLLAEGLSNSALARRLEISPHTARHHTQRVLGKLAVHSRAEAGAKLRR